MVSITATESKARNTSIAKKTLGKKTKRHFCQFCGERGTKSEMILN